MSQWYSWTGLYDLNATIRQISLDVLQTVCWLCAWSQIHIKCYDLLLEVGVSLFSAIVSPSLHSIR